jgi:hypothetical protein
MRGSVAFAAVSAVLLLAGGAGAEKVDVEGKAWLAGHADPAAINVHGIWKSKDWGTLVLNQAQGGRDVTGTGDDWRILGVVSGKQVWLVFYYLETDGKTERTGKQKLGYSAVLDRAGDDTLQGTYEGGLAKTIPRGKPISMTRILPQAAGMNPDGPWTDYMPSVPPDKAFVFVYRIHAYVGAVLKPGVFLDDTKVADIENGTYLIAKVAPGPHRLRSTDKQRTEISVDAKPGEKYYVRVKVVTGLPGKGRVISATAEEGEAEVRSLLPVDPSRIYEPKVVLVPGFDKTESGGSPSPGGGSKP